MKKFFFLFLLSLSNVTFAASDVIVDAVTCKTFEGKDLKLILLRKVSCLVYLLIMP